MNIGGSKVNIQTFVAIILHETRKFHSINDANP